MKEFSLKLIFGRRGYVEYLIAIPLLLLAAGTILSITESVSASDVDIARGMEAAANAACYDVLDSSVSDTDPLTGRTPVINSDGGYSYFADALQKNLGLDAAFSPAAGSYMSSRPDFVLVIYNGNNLYGAPVCRKYRYQGGVLSSFDVASSGTFPETFAVTSLDVNPGSGGIKSYTLSTPGVVAAIRAPLKQIHSSQSLIVERSMSEKIQTY